MAGKHGRNGFDDDNVNPFAVSVPSVIRTTLSLRRPSTCLDLEGSWRTSPIRSPSSALAIGILRFVVAHVLDLSVLRTRNGEMRICAFGVW